MTSRVVTPALVLLLALGLHACGRIGYDPLLLLAGDGGTSGSGGVLGAGGMLGSGGASGLGGASNAGGAPGIGGTSGIGGTPGIGGAPGTGGVSGVGGGAPGTGGSSGLGGAPSITGCMAKTFNGKNYLMCSPKVTWTAARDSCASVGMGLVRIDDAAENQWLFDNAYDPSTTSAALWIGASDQAVNGEWRWLDGTLFWLGLSNGAAQGGLYANWYSNYPNGTGNNHCGALDLGVGTTPKWYVDRCMGSTDVYACESQ